MVASIRRKKIPLNDLVEEYKSIVERHGDCAFNSNWFQKYRENGVLQYQWLYRQVSKSYKIKWSDFVIEICGYKVTPFFRKSLSVQELIEKHKEMYKELGNCVLSSKWMVDQRENKRRKYYWMMQRLRSLGVNWSEFIKKCNYKEDPKNRIGISLEDKIEIFKEAYKKYGDDVFNSIWIKMYKENDKLKFRWLYAQVRVKHDLSWNEFVTLAGFNGKLVTRNLMKIPLNDLTQEMRNIVNIHGINGFSSDFIQMYKENGKRIYYWLYTQVYQKHSLDWKCFVQMCKSEIEMKFEWD